MAQLLLLDEMELTLKATLDAAEGVASSRPGADADADCELHVVGAQLRAALERLPVSLRRAIDAERHPTLFRSPCRPAGSGHVGGRSA